MASCERLGTVITSFITGEDTDNGQQFTHHIRSTHKAQSI